MAVSSDNPFGVEDFDHTAFAPLPEYRHLAEAMDLFVQRVTDDGDPLSQTDWLETVRHVAAILSFATTCSAAHGGDRRVFPHAGRLDGGGGAVLRYRCAVCEQEWSKLWALGPPKFL
jgi:hypothetical protein